MADNEGRWYLKKFSCTCGAEYWFEVSEMETAIKAAPAFQEERDYLFFCNNTCQKNKVVSYKAADIEYIGPG